jgi:hypothetical protein
MTLLPLGTDGRDEPTTNVVGLDAGRRAAARTTPPPRAAAPALQHAAFHSALDFARKAYDELDPGTALIQLNVAARILAEPAA